MIDTTFIDKELQKAIDGLSEHCDSVRIFVTVTEDGKTLGRTVGAGNYYAQIAQTREFGIHADEEARRNCTKYD